MHRALLIADIVRLVCENADQRTLASLSLCSSGLHYEANRALWRQLDNLTPLVALFPQDAWELLNNELRLLRPLVPGDWAAFLRIAPFVKALTIDLQSILAPSKWSRRTLRQDVIPAVVAQRPQEILLPSLRHLRQESILTSHAYLADLISVVGEQLTELSLDYSDLDTRYELPRIMRVIHRRFPRLQSFSVSVPESVDELQEMGEVQLVVAPGWLNTCHLTTFNCATVTLTEEAIGALSSLGSLKKVSMRLPRQCTFPSMASVDAPFRHVQDISLHATMGTYMSFIKTVRTLPRVAEFDLEIDCLTEPFDGVTPRDLIGATASLLPEGLDSLSVMAYDCDQQLDLLGPAIRAQVVAHSEDFKPLLKFSTINSFMWEMPWVYHLDDSFLSDVARKWPHLIDFHLGVQSYCLSPPGGPGVTLRAFPPFAVHCLGLRELGFQLKAVPPPGDWDIAPDSSLYGELLEESCCRSESLVYYLTVRRSPIKQPEAVAGFLNCVFPELRIVVMERSAAGHMEPRWPKYRKAWEEVARYLPILRMVRRNEREKAELDGRDSRSDWVDGGPDTDDASDEW